MRTGNNRGKLRITVLILMLILHYRLHASGKQFSDSLETEMNKQFRLDIVAVSPKGGYALVSKKYNLKSDTVMVVEASKPGRKVTEVIGMQSGTFFLSEKAIVAYGIGKAEYTDLTTLEKRKYDQVRSVTVIPEKGTFMILDQSQNLSSYDQNGSLRFDLSGVEKFSLTGQPGYLCIVKNRNNCYEVTDVSSEKPVVVYRTDKTIRRIEMSFSKTWLSVIEEDGEGSERKELLVLINMKTGAVQRPRLDEIHQNQFIGVSEMSNGEGLLISLSIKILKDRKIETWYGNDGNLIDTELGFTSKNSYLIFDPAGNQVKSLISERFDTFCPTGNTRYLLARKKGEGNNYTCGFSNLELYIWDIQTGEYRFLDDIYPTRVFMPSKGNYLLYKNSNGKWVLADISNGQKKVFSEDFSMPVFSSSSPEIFFEGKTGFYSYNIPNDQLRSWKELENSEVKISERKTLNMGSSYLGFFISETKSRKLLLKITDKQGNTTSFQWLDRGRLENCIPSTSDHIAQFRQASERGHIWYTCENYNRPMSVWYKSSSRTRPVEIISPNRFDNVATLLKQETLEYRNSEGQPLKSVLFYPENFDPLKKYPVIVRIYEGQHTLGNRYYTSSYEQPLEVDVRAMLKKGYFIYLPDIVTGKKGTGLSALDCVHASLDALKDKPFIDSGKIGLTGHSHGGYETNFIATHSKRFAAYFSGSGNADIIKSYFSYNNNFHSAFYWQFENGQYNLKKAFAEDKELYFKNNPVYYAENVSAPILLWAGKKDENIKWEQAMEFYIALRRNKKHVIAVFYPDQGHYPESASRENKDLYSKMIDWWDYFLKDKKDIPWIDQQMKIGR